MHALDQPHLRRLTDSIAARFDEQDFFCAEIRARLLERLQLITLQPEQIHQVILDRLGATAPQRAVEAATAGGS